MAKKLKNVRVHDNGAAFIITVDGMITSAHNSLGGAWRHIEWMYRIATQNFTVGLSETPVKEWVEKMHELGYMT